MVLIVVAVVVGSVGCASESAEWPKSASAAASRTASTTTTTAAVVTGFPAMTSWREVPHVENDRCTRSSRRSSRHPPIRLHTARQYWRECRAFQQNVERLEDHVRN
jgi:hypothetical protein